MRVKRKIPSFVFGVSIGLIIGVAFFLFKLDDIFSRFKESLSTDKITVIEQKVESDEEKEKQRNKERFKIKSNYASNVNYKEVDSIINSEASINVATDELIATKKVQLINLDNIRVDTTAQNLAGVNPVSSEYYFIEFWKTPLNSKGYRFTKNKIMLYGFTDFNSVLLYQLQARYFIKSFDIVYEIQQNSEFQPFIKVNNNELLSKLNS